MQVLKTPYIQNPVLGLPKIDTAKIIHAVTVVALAAIATHMITNLPGASAFDMSATNPAMAAATPGVWESISSGASSFAGGTAKFAGNLLSGLKNAPTYNNNVKINPVIKGCGDAVAHGGQGGSAIASVNVPDPGILGSLSVLDKKTG